MEEGILQLLFLILISIYRKKTVFDAVDIEKINMPG